MSKLINKQKIKLQPALLFFFEINISFWAGLILNIILLNEVNITLLNRLTYTQNLLYNVNDTACVKTIQNE